jgi:hypothetical protein
MFVRGALHCFRLKTELEQKRGPNLWNVNNDNKKYGQNAVCTSFFKDVLIYNFEGSYFFFVFLLINSMSVCPIPYVRINTIDMNRDNCLETFLSGWNIKKKEN